MRIQTKLISGFLIVALLISIIGLVAINTSEAIIEPFKEVKKKFMPATIVLEDMEYASFKMGLALHEYILYDQEKYELNFKNAAAEALIALDAYEQIEAREETETIESLRQQLIILSGLGNGLIQLKNEEATIELISSEEKRFHQNDIIFENTLLKEIDKDHDELDQAYAKVENTIKQSRQAALFSLISIFVIAISLGFLSHIQSQNLLRINKSNQ